MPIYALWPDPRLLLTVRLLAVSIAALPIYGIALQDRASRFAALCIARLFSSSRWSSKRASGVGATSVPRPWPYPCWLARSTLSSANSWLIVFLLLLLAMTSKEHVSLLVASLGVFLLLGRRHWRQGIGLIVLGVDLVRAGSMGLFALGCAMGRCPPPLWSLPSALGGDQGVTGLVKTIVARPVVLWETLVVRSKLDFVFFLLLGLALLPLLGAISAVVLPVYVLFLLYPRSRTWGTITT